MSSPAIPRVDFLRRTLRFDRQLICRHVPLRSWARRTPAGLPLDGDRFGQQWRPACRAAGVPGLGYHSLRHTFASTLLFRGVSVKAVADWLGHASPVITFSTYAHLMPADEEVARAVLDAALGAPADTPRTEPGAHTADLRLCA